MTKDEALRMALEALEYFSDTATLNMDKAFSEDAITAIKKALAQPVSSHGNAEDLYLEMSKHLNCPHRGGSGHIDDVAQPEQEPFCYVNVNAQGDVTRTVKRKDAWCRTPLYTTPPQRTWVGLDLDERAACYEKSGGNLSKFADQIESKLREKNA